MNLKKHKMDSDTKEWVMQNYGKTEQHLRGASIFYEKRFDKKFLVENINRDLRNIDFYAGITNEEKRVFMIKHITSDIRLFIYLLSFYEYHLLVGYDNHKMMSPEQFSTSEQCIDAYLKIIKNEQ